LRFDILAKVGNLGGAGLGANFKVLGTEFVKITVFDCILEDLFEVLDGFGRKYFDSGGWFGEFDYPGRSVGTRRSQGIEGVDYLELIDGKALTEGGGDQVKVRPVFFDKWFGFPLKVNSGFLAEA